MPAKDDAVVSLSPDPLPLTPLPATLLPRDVLQDESIAGEEDERALEVWPAAQQGVAGAATFPLISVDVDEYELAAGVGETGKISHKLRVVSDGDNYLYIWRKLIYDVRKCRLCANR